MTNRLMRSAASVIKHTRKASGMTQEDLAALSGLDRTYISGVERGARNITLDSLEQIVDALGMPLHEFAQAMGKTLNLEGLESKNAEE